MQKRLEYLDSSRGLAAITVVFSHFFGAFGLFPNLENFSNSSLHIFWHGDGAVGYFYVLSGYVLSLSFFKERNPHNNFNIVHYLIKRIFRIFPLFITCIIISYFILSLYVPHIPLKIYPAETSWVLNLWKEKLTILQAIRESFIIFYLPDSQVKLLPQGWSLQAELICSSLIPISIILFQKQKALFFLFFLYVYFNGNWSFIAFVFGIIIAYYSDYLIKTVSSINNFYLLLLLIIGVFFYTAPFNFLNFIILKSPGLQFKFQCIGACIFLIIIIGNNFLKKLLNNKILCFFGKISYSIYLTHMFILIPLIPYIIKYLNNNNVTGEYSVRFTALFVLLSLTFVVSYVLYKIIEEPFIKVSKNIVQYKILNNQFWQ